jgi:hypothetical protein
MGVLGQHFIACGAVRLTRSIDDRIGLRNTRSRFFELPPVTTQSVPCWSAILVRQATGRAEIMSQKYAAYDSTGAIVAFYDSVDSPAPQGATVI